jgi:hypothetical protein
MKDSKGWKFGELIKVDELGKQVGADTIEIDEYSITIKKGGENATKRTGE